MRFARGTRVSQLSQIYLGNSVVPSYPSLVTRK